MVESSPHLQPWRDTITDAGYGAGPRLDGPLCCRVVFTMPRPASAPKKRPYLPDKKPDLDKLLRALFDAVTTAGLWADDARVVDVWAKKVAVGDGVALPVPGVVVAVAAAWHDVTDLYSSAVRSAVARFAEANPA